MVEKVSPAEWPAYLSKLGKSQIYTELLKPGDLAFDIGANRGLKTNALLNSGAGHVVAVEPLLAVRPCPVNHLRTGFGKDERVTLVAKAVSDVKGKAPLHVCRVFTGYSTMSKRWHDGMIPQTIRGEWVNVPTVTLDGLIAKYGVPAFIKIDVEDYESVVLGTLSQNVKSLSIEFHHRLLSDTRICLKHLGRLGTYEYNLAYGGKPDKLVLKTWIVSAQMLARLARLPDRGPESWGDIYARMA